MKHFIGALGEMLGVDSLKSDDRFEGFLRSGLAAVTLFSAYSGFLGFALISALVWNFCVAGGSSWLKELWKEKTQGFDADKTTQQMPEEDSLAPRDMEDAEEATTDLPDSNNSNSEGTTSMSTAVIANINARTKLGFKQKFDPSEGSFYLLAIEQEEVVMVLNSAIEDVKKIYKTSKKPIISGSYWEENIEYSYGEMNSGNTLTVEVSGEFAFELDDDDGLDGYDVDDGPIQSVLLAWAVDGDSPKILSTYIDGEGELSDCREDSEFEGF